MLRNNGVFQYSVSVVIVFVHGVCVGNLVLAVSDPLTPVTSAECHHQHLLSGDMPRKGKADRGRAKKRIRSEVKSQVRPSLSKEMELSTDAICPNLSLRAANSERLGNLGFTTNAVPSIEHTLLRQVSSH